MFRSLVIIILNFQNYEIYKKANENIKIKRMSKQKYSIIACEHLKNVKSQVLKNVLSKYTRCSFDKSFFLN